MRYRAIINTFLLENLDTIAKAEELAKAFEDFNQEHGAPGRGNMKHRCPWGRHTRQIVAPK